MSSLMIVGLWIKKAVEVGSFSLSQLKSL